MAVFEYVWSEFMQTHAYLTMWYRIVSIMHVIVAKEAPNVTLVVIVLSTTLEYIMFLFAECQLEYKLIKLSACILKWQHLQQFHDA